LSATVSVCVNGVARDVAASSVADLVAALGLAGKRIAVERNGEIVPRSRYAQTPLANGDRLEIVGAVGGG
jgi:sulfur carrier protein